MKPVTRGCLFSAIFVSILVAAFPARAGGPGSPRAAAPQTGATRALGGNRGAVLGSGPAGVLECLLFGCNPQITQVVPFVSAITPGGAAFVQGTGFGATMGPQSVGADGD